MSSLKRTVNAVRRRKELLRKALDASLAAMERVVGTFQEKEARRVIFGTASEDQIVNKCRLLLRVAPAGRFGRLRGFLSMTRKRIFARRTLKALKEDG